MDTEVIVPQSQQIVLDSQTTFTVIYQATLGELLLSTLITILIFLYVLKWLHNLIFEKRLNHVRSDSE